MALEYAESTSETPEAISVALVGVTFFSNELANWSVRVRSASNATNTPLPRLADLNVEC